MGLARGVDDGRRPVEDKAALVAALRQALAEAGGPQGEQQPGRCPIHQCQGAELVAATVAFLDEPVPQRFQLKLA